MILKRLSIISFSLFISITLFAQIKSPAIKTDAGLVSGITKDSLHIFKGIPFASPPVGALRWKAPQPVKHWTGVRQCDTFSASPMQASPAPFSMWSEEFLIRKEPISEDCLYLNVWTSSTSANKKSPVLVWIYGGGFVSGGSNVPIYDGEAMAKKGIVFVSFNYRVGIFGFFAHPELTKEAPYHASGNYGILDQIAALKWVQKNIAAFGGDPNNVTIAGQSAGAASVNFLMASPLAKDLFNKAIGESGSAYRIDFAVNDLKHAEEIGLTAQKSLNAKSIAGMRKLPASVLMKTQTMRGIIWDNYVMQHPVIEIENKVPLLSGWNENEGLTSGPIKNAADFKAYAQSEYREINMPVFLGYYPADNDSIAAISQLNLDRDKMFGLGAFIWAVCVTAKNNNAYLYRFTHKVPATGEYVKYGAFHTGEVPYALDNLKFVNRPFTEVDYKLADVMSSYWVNFIKTGNPNGSGLAEWKPVGEKEMPAMMLDTVQYCEPMKDFNQIMFLFYESVRAENK